MIWRMYKAASWAGQPFFKRLLRQRLEDGKEDAERIGERIGKAGRPRPEGVLLWCHAASVGEMNSALPLLIHLHDAHPKLHILLTTGTVTSARLVEPRLKERMIHQFSPIDTAQAVTRFLDHWKPDLAFWVESELWPNLILGTHKRHIPMLLINARLSPRSARQWQRVPGPFRQLLDCFSLILPQSRSDTNRLAALGAQHLTYLGNLKFATPPLPTDETELARLEASLSNRPCWVAASTHAGEEEQVAEAHKRIAAKHPHLLTLLIPRHARRGELIAALLRGRGLNIAQRSRNEPIRQDTDIYLADTMGELGLFYRLSDIVFVGGSLIEHGGQNPLEPALLSNALITGPHHFNFSDIVMDMMEAGAMTEIADADALADTVGNLLDHHDLTLRQVEAARRIAESESGVMERVSDAVLPYITAAMEKTDAAA